MSLGNALRGEKLASGAATGLQLLVGAPEFWRRADADARAARRRLHVQAMSFEGDGAGLAVAAAITASEATDRRVLVDDYTRLMINDRLVRSPAGRMDKAVRREALATDAMFRGLVAAGVRVRVTNPVGRWGAGYPARNHKKLIVADDVAYIGGINFCDHNFAWQDLMLRLQGRAAADFLAADFEATFAGAPRAASADLGDVRLSALDGRSNAQGFAEVLELIVSARRRITVVSPYLTFPFTDELARAVRRGVHVRVITPWASNKPTVRNALLADAARAGFEVRLLPAMTHLKGMLIDNARLVLGSSNFDFASLAAEEELLAVVAAPALIAAFCERVIEPALAEALPTGAHGVSPIVGRASRWALKIAERAASAARLAPRTARDWPTR